MHKVDESAQANDRQLGCEEGKVRGEGGTRGWYQVLVDGALRTSPRGASVVSMPHNIACM